MAKKTGKRKKEPKRKPKYGFFSCVGFIYSYMWKHERALAWVAILCVPVSLLFEAIGLYTPSIIIRTLETSGVFSYVVLVIGGLVLANLILRVVSNGLGTLVGNAEFFIVSRLVYDRQVFNRNRDAYLELSPEVQKMDSRAGAAVANNHTAGVHFPMDVADMLGTVLQFLLFGTVVSFLNPWILLIIAVGCAFNYLMAKWERDANYKTRDKRNLVYKKLNYLAYNVSKDLKYGKDVRLYNLRDYLSLLAKKLVGESKIEQEKLERRSFFTSLVSFFVVLVRDGAAYYILIEKALAGEVDAASFVLYFSAITSLSGFMASILNSVSRLQEGALQISDYREAFDIRGKLNTGKGTPLPNGPFSIEFQNVSFKYPEGEKTILDHVSFRIEAGEKIAVVGLNGAGKTTMTKLMCGLLIPDEGEVLLDGRSVFEYNKDELYSLFGLVPQEYAILPVSIARNIALNGEGEAVDETRLARCIETAGLSEKISELPLGKETPLVRQVNPCGVDLSGGETQKLLLARALYRDPKCLILDEPTAALDPIAEDRMYRKYNEIAAHATSVFISHRLASTCFCDRIFLIDGAQITEEGSHDELMAKGGKYKELFDIQSKYYREEVTDHA